MPLPTGHKTYYQGEEVPKIFTSDELERLVSAAESQSVADVCLVQLLFTTGEIALWIFLPV